MTKLKDNAELVKAEIQSSPDTSKSHCPIAERLGIPPTSVYKIMKDLKLKPYIPHLHQRLNEDDPDRRLEFCEFCCCMTNVDPHYPSKILWSDEATFHTSKST